MDTNFSVIVWRYLISSYKDPPDENGETQLAEVIYGLMILR